MGPTVSSRAIEIVLSCCVIIASSLRHPIAAPPRGMPCCWAEAAESGRIVHLPLKFGLAWAKALPPKTKRAASGRRLVRRMTGYSEREGGVEPRCERRGAQTFAGGGLSP